MSEPQEQQEASGTTPGASPRRGVLYITFGVQYATLAEADEAYRSGRPFSRDPHPTADWATGNGYLAVEYGLSATDLEPEYIAAARERARQAAWAWLGGVYAFDYDEPPEPEYAPFGEVARMVLP